MSRYQYREDFRVGEPTGRSATPIVFLIIGIGFLAVAIYACTANKKEAAAQLASLPSPTAVQNAVAAPSNTPQPTPTDPWEVKFSDKFTTGGVVKDSDSYKSANIDITVSKYETGNVTYFVADIYLADIDSFKTAFAGGSLSSVASDTIRIADNNSAVLALSGDYCGDRKDGMVIRNGQLLRDGGNQDILVLYNDGSMKTYSPGQITGDEAIQNGAYQAWSFGPKLLSGGQPMDTFNSEVAPRNPRAAIGYYEPGHYCFVLVDGRQAGYSEGMTLKELSQLFYSLGCKEAYNLDGGQSAVMTYGGGVVNQPYKDGRPVGDILYIADIP